MNRVLSITTLEQYAREVLHLQHGEVDVGGSSTPAPPVSRRGRILDLKKNKAYGRPDSIIGLCRLEIDTKCGPWSPSDILEVDVHEYTEHFFSELLKSVKELPQLYSSMAFCTLAFVTFSWDDGGILPTPARLISALSSYSREMRSGGEPCFDEADCTLDRILFSSRGLLLLDDLTLPGSEKEILLRPYCEQLTYFMERGLSPLVSETWEQFKKHVK